MRIFTLLLVLSVLCTQLNAQHKAKLHVDIALNIDGPTSGALSNNTGGFGANLGLLYDAGKKFSPFLEFSSDFFWGDKLYYIGPGGNHVDQHYKIYNLFAGAKLSITSRSFFSVSAGPSFNTILFAQQTNLGIKPALEFNFLKSRRLLGRVSYTNIFRSGGTESYVSLAAGYRLF